MNGLIIAAGITAAFNSSLVWGGRIVSVFEGASEPVGLAIWGLALFLVAGSLKKLHGNQRSRLASFLPPFRALAPEQEVTLKARKAEAGI